MTERAITEMRSQAAQGRDRDDPDHPHCGRCGSDELVATMVISPMSAPVEVNDFAAHICDVCAQRIIDLLVNPHLFLTAETTNSATMMADLMIDGTGISRPDAISMLINAAEMLNTGEAEVVAHYDPITNQDES